MKTKMYVQLSSSSFNHKISQSPILKIHLSAESINAGMNCTHNSLYLYNANEKKIIIYGTQGNLRKISY